MSANERSMATTARSTVRWLLTILLVLVVAILCLRDPFEHDRAVVASLGPVHHFARVGEPIFLSLPPHVVGYYAWTGPAFLEWPMRCCGIPWFDRMERVDILNDSGVTAGKLAELGRLPHLKQVQIDAAALPRILYTSSLVEANPAISITFVE